MAASRRRPLGRFQGARHVKTTGHRKYTKTFSLSFDELDNIGGQYLAAIAANARTAPKSVSRDEIVRVIRGIVNDELYDLGKNVLEPVLRSYAPRKQGYEKKHLDDSIQAIRDLAFLSLKVRMNWYGDLTIKGRNGPAPGTRVRMELPGGGERWFTVGDDAASDGSATKRAEGDGDPTHVPPLNATAARFRMEWFKRAMEQVERNNWFAQYGENIAQRMTDEFFRGLLGDHTAMTPRVQGRPRGYKALAVGRVRTRFRHQDASLAARHAKESDRIQKARARNANTLRHFHRESLHAHKAAARAQTRQQHLSNRRRALQPYLRSNVLPPRGRHR